MLEQALIRGDDSDYSHTSKKDLAGDEHNRKARAVYKVLKLPVERITRQQLPCLRKPMPHARPCSRHPEWVWIADGEKYGPCEHQPSCSQF